jgi:hypothetical protein
VRGRFVDTARWPLAGLTDWARARPSPHAPPVEWRRPSVPRPNTRWPDDRTWMVITEIDGYSSYVGWSRESIDELLVEPEIEAIEVPLDVPMDPGAYPPSVALASADEAPVHEMPTPRGAPHPAPQTQDRTPPAE